MRKKGKALAQGVTSKSAGPRVGYIPSSSGKAGFKKLQPSNLYGSRNHHQKQRKKGRKREKVFIRGRK